MEVKSTQHKINHFKSERFRGIPYIHHVVRMQDTHHLYLVPKDFGHLERKPRSCKQSLLILHTRNPRRCPRPRPSPGNRQLTFCLYRLACSGHFLYMESYTMWPFVSGFFTLYNVSEVHSRQYVSEPHSFLWLNDTPLWRQTTFVYPSTQLWAFGTFHLLAAMATHVRTLV